MKGIERVRISGTVEAELGRGRGTEFRMSIRMEMDRNSLVHLQALSKLNFNESPIWVDRSRLKLVCLTL